MMTSARALLVALLTVAVGGLVSPAVATAAPPTNDDFDNAVALGALPYRASIDTRDATWSGDDPSYCYNSGSVWFTVTPTEDGFLDLNADGSDYFASVSVYTGLRGRLNPVFGTCSSGPTVVEVAAGTTYHVMAARCCDYGGNGGGLLDLAVSLRTGPANDDFADAAVVPAIPFSTTVDSLAATRESGEPRGSCNNGDSGTVWFAHTATETGSLTARANGPFTTTTSVYTGTAFADLDEVACAGFSDGLTFRAEAGRTYYFQSGGHFGGGSPLTFAINRAVQPVASYFASPHDPSQFDTVRFHNQSFDPADADFVSVEWDFGDGTTSTENSPTHRYGVDGDYPLRLTVTTTDGRTATAADTFRVRTHDVEIASFEVPATARVGQSRPVTVGIRNTRYPEVVTVELYKSVPGGFERVGELTQSVPVRPNRNTPFPFGYTFTDEDATVGKVTFKAVAVLPFQVRDALPADNTVVAVATRVKWPQAL